MKHLISILFGIAMYCVVPSGLLAQCPVENTAFEAGEQIDYELFFNWQFIWIKAGTATLKTSSVTINEKDFYRYDLITQTSKRLDKFFMMRDTLMSVTDKRIIPYYYKKAANEGGKYYIDEVNYSYPGDTTVVDHYKLNRNGEVYTSQTRIAECVYDMVSLMFRARCECAEGLKKGDKLVYKMADGKKVEDVNLLYRGKKNVKIKEMNQNYKCLVFSFVEYKGGKEHEIITFYITDDQKHIPVRLDMNLKFGTAKAYLRKMTTS